MNLRSSHLGLSNQEFEIGTCGPTMNCACGVVIWENVAWGNTITTAASSNVTNDRLF